MRPLSTKYLAAVSINPCKYQDQIELTQPTGYTQSATIFGTRSIQRKVCKENSCWIIESIFYSFHIRGSIFNKVNIEKCLYKKRFGCIVDCIVCSFHNRSNLSYKASEIMEHFNICSILRKNTDEHPLSGVNMKSGKETATKQTLQKTSTCKRNVCHRGVIMWYSCSM